jgi:SAM-dependent methyltransferase
VGRLSAIGTAGAIVGTFLTGFVLLGLFPTRVLIIGTGVLLVALGVLVSVVYGGRAGTAILAALAAATFAGAVTTPTLCDRESAYYCIRIVADPGNPNGRTLVLDGLRHAHVDLSDPLDQQFRYLRWFTDAVSGPIGAAGGDVDVVHIGGGGFTFPRFLSASWPASRHTVLELDPVILATARAEMGFRETDGIRVVVGDARLSLRSVASDSQALAVGDAFGGLSVPWHLTTREFLVEIDRVLLPDGRYVMNVIDGPALRFTRAEAATLRSVFDQVVLIATRSSLAGDSGGNLVLVASQSVIDVGAIRLALTARGDLDAQLVGDADLAAFVDGAATLTDDMAPVDLLIGR